MMGLISISGEALLPVILLAYYLLAWTFAGRNPKSGAIVAQYAPPNDMSPAEARYLFSGTVDYKTTAAVIAHLASQKVLSITPEGDAYRITRLMDALPSNLPEEEAAALRAIVEVESFGNAAHKASAPHGNSFSLRPGRNDNKVSLITSVITGAITKHVQGRYFDGNYRYSLSATAVSFVAAWFMSLRVAGHEGVAFETIWFLLCGSIISLIVAGAFAPALRDALQGRLSLRQISISLLPLAAFAAVLGFVAKKIAEGSSMQFAGMLIAIVILNSIFISLLRRMTPIGRQRLDQLLGFRQFLQSVELDRFNRLNDPRLTPALMNDYLAYAIALDLKEAWGDHLSNAFFATATTTTN